jgi:hypothetical protein
MITLKLKLSQEEIWPEPYQGQTVEVGVKLIQFPNGMTWSVDTERYARECEIVGTSDGEKGTVVTEKTTLRDILGPGRWRVEIDYLSDKPGGAS